MPIRSFSIVLVGENFPVASIRTEHFQFRHRALRETVRLPVALQAERDGVSLQVIPMRFEAAVTVVDNVAIQTTGLVDMTKTFFDYVGRRTITAVGHNVVWQLEDDDERARRELFDALLVRQTVDQVLASVGPVSADLSFRFRRGDESAAIMLVKMSEPDKLTLQLNFNFDISDEMSAEAAVERLAQSVGHATALAADVAALVARHEVEA